MFLFLLHISTSLNSATRLKDCVYVYVCVCLCLRVCVCVFMRVRKMFHTEIKASPQCFLSVQRVTHWLHTVSYGKEFLRRLARSRISLTIVKVMADINNLRMFLAGGSRVSSWLLFLSADLTGWHNLLDFLLPTFSDLRKIYRRSTGLNACARQSVRRCQRTSPHSVLAELCLKTHTEENQM